MLTCLNCSRTLHHAGMALDHFYLVQKRVNELNPFDWDSIVRVPDWPVEDGTTEPRTNFPYLSFFDRFQSVSNHQEKTCRHTVLDLKWKQEIELDKPEVKPDVNIPESCEEIDESSSEWPEPSDSLGRSTLPAGADFAPTKKIGKMRIYNLDGWIFTWDIIGRKPNFFIRNGTRWLNIDTGTNFWFWRKGQGHWWTCDWRVYP